MNHLVKTIKMIIEEVVAVVLIPVAIVLNEVYLLLKEKVVERRRREGKRGELSNFTKISGHCNNQVNARISRKSDQLTLRTTEVAAIN